MHGPTKTYPVSLPEDPRFMGTTLAQTRADVPGVETWRPYVHYP